MSLNSFLMLAFAVLFGSSAAAQSQVRSGPSPRDVVERLWVDATAGNLLNTSGLKRTSAHYQLSPDFFRKPITVISNDWAIDEPQVEGDAASVIVGYFELGKLDSKLRFKDAPDDPCGTKAFAMHKLTFAPTFTLMYADGKTLIEKKPSYRAWQFKDPVGWRWTTVNTAIRYVMDMRAKTSDPEIKKNADKTLATLMRYH